MSDPDSTIPFSFQPLGVAFPGRFHCHRVSLQRAEEESVADRELPRGNKSCSGKEQRMARVLSQRLFRLFSGLSPLIETGLKSLITPGTITPGSA